MQCVDCHFAQDTTATATSKARSWARSRSGARIATARSDAYPTLQTSGPAAAPAAPICRCCAIRTASNRFEWMQRQTRSSARRSIRARMEDDPGQGHGRSGSPGLQREGRARQADARTIRTIRNGAPAVPEEPARAQRQTRWPCYACHTSWTTSCGGCHLPIEANWKTERHNYEGERHAQLRHLQSAGRARRHVPARHPRRRSRQQDRAGALVVGAGPVVDQHQPRTDLCAAAADLGRRAFRARPSAPHFPHTVRKTETKTCDDCHLEGQRQQRDHGAAAAARHQFRQLRRLSMPGSARQATSRRCRSPNGTSRRR